VAQPSTVTDDDAVRRGLLVRLLTLGEVAIGAFAAGYALIGLRVLFWVEATYFLAVAMTLVALRVGRPSVSRVALLHALLVFAVIAANTLILGGFLPSAGFAVWAYLPPLAAMFLVRGRSRMLLNAATAAFLVGVLLVEPWLTPIEAIPPTLLRVFFFLNISCTVLVVLGSLSYFHHLLLTERLAVADSERRHRATLEHLPIGVALRGQTGGYHFANPAFELLFQTTSDRLQRDGDDALPPATRAAWQTLVQRAALANGAGEADGDVPIGDEVRHLRLTRQDVSDAAGRAIDCLVCDDMTLRARAERSVQNARHLEALGTLAGGIAHDFNNLLMAVQGNLDLAQSEQPGSAVAGRLEAASRAVVRSRELTRQILTFARGGLPSLTRTDLTALVEESASFARVGTAAHLTIDIAPELPAVDADAGQLGRVLHNLVLNAAQAMPNGGEIAIHAGIAASSALPPELASDRTYVCIDVTDQGEGIPEALRQRVFDPFFSTRPTGSGLGLTTSHSIVRQHGGALVLLPARPRGTTARVFLPAAAGPPEVRAASSAVPVAPAPRTLLVMDDEPEVREVLVALFASLGHTVAACADGAEAVAAFRAAAARAQPPDAVVLDLTVPGGVGGLEAARQILALQPRAVLIAASGYADALARGSLQQAGFRATLAKPFGRADAQAALAAAWSDRTPPAVEPPP
jgi:signal transduction histidine kinase/CheY-like chemotaxis protein